MKTDWLGDYATGAELLGSLDLFRQNERRKKRFGHVPEIGILCNGREYFQPVPTRKVVIHQNDVGDAGVMLSLTLGGSDTFLDGRIVANFARHREASKNLFHQVGVSLVVFNQKYSSRSH